LATPKNQDFLFSNIEFSTTLSLRLHLPLSNIPPNQICNCKNKVLLDPTGHHLLSGCNEGGNRQHHHKAVQFTLSKIFNFAGFRNTVEETNCFSRNDPNNHLRPDISVHNAQALKYNNDLLLDISIASPLEGIQKGTFIDLSITQGKKFFRSARARFHSKLSKYSERARENNKSFLPFIIETSGAIFPNSIDLLKDTAKIGSDRSHIPYNIFYNYIIKLISCTVHKSFSSCIHNKISKILIPKNITSFIDKNINDIVGINIFNNTPYFNIPYFN
jgi:hypothetical protein